MRSLRSRLLLFLLASSAAAAILALVSSSARTATSPRLDMLSAMQLVDCRAVALVRPVCPRGVPRVVGGYRALLTRDGKLEPALYVFDLERFAVPLRPPKGAHITAAAGAVWRLTPYQDPTSESVVRPLSDHVNVNRWNPVSFGVRQWGRRQGILYLAPPYLHGGQLGDHLVFQWGTGNRMHVLSLHRWSPLTETVATLRAMVIALG